MQFRDFSQTAVENLWNRWNHDIRRILVEFNEDVFDGRGNIRANTDCECLYLLLETNYGCLYVFPLPGNEIALRIFRHRIERVTPALMSTQHPPMQDDYVGGFRFLLDTLEQRHYRTAKTFHEIFAEALTRVFREYWLELFY